MDKEPRLSSKVKLQLVIPKISVQLCQCPTVKETSRVKRTAITVRCGCEFLPSHTQSLYTAISESTRDKS